MEFAATAVFSGDGRVEAMSGTVILPKRFLTFISPVCHVRLVLGDVRPHEQFSFERCDGDHLYGYNCSERVCTRGSLDHSLGRHVCVSPSFSGVLDRPPRLPSGAATVRIVPYG